MQSFVPLARNSLLVALLMVHATCSALLPDAVWINPILSRRNALASGVASAGFLLGNSSKGQKLALAEEGGQTYQTYKVEPDASAALSPRLTAIPVSKFYPHFAIFPKLVSIIR